MECSNVINDEKSKDLFKNLKSKYILIKILDNLSKSKSLNILKYNKKLQNRIDKSINDYKEYCEIEIELILVKKPVKKPVNFSNRYFINVFGENKKYCHIYFDNNKEEANRNYLYEKDEINSIKIILDSQIKSFDMLFHGCPLIESINFKNFKRNDINNMNYIYFLNVVH